MCLTLRSRGLTPVEPEQAMPRYYFNLADGHRERDDDGVELAGLNEARREAVVFLGATLRDEPDMIGDGQSLCVEVWNGRRELVFMVTARSMDAPPGR